MSNLGSRLKQAREARGIDLREIAAATKISVTNLEALERNDFSRLPGGIFSRSFVRAYALAVDLDPDAAVDDLLAALDQSARDAERNARKPEISADDRAFLARQQRALKQLRLGVAVVLVLVAAAAIWWFWGRGGSPDPASPGEASPAAPAASSPSADPLPPPGSARHLRELRDCVVGGTMLPTIAVHVSPRRVRHSDRIWARPSMYTAARSRSSSERIALRSITARFRSRSIVLRVAL